MKALLAAEDLSVGILIYYASSKSLVKSVDMSTVKLVQRWLGR
jgi:hypothetical protein